MGKACEEAAEVSVHGYGGLSDEIDMLAGDYGDRRGDPVYMPHDTYLATGTVPPIPFTVCNTSWLDSTTQARVDTHLSVPLW